MKKKKTPAKNKATSANAPLAPLDSRNWVSESSMRFAAEASAPPNDSGSGAPPPPACGSNSTPPDSVAVKEKAIAGGQGPIQGLGYTAYKSKEFDTRVFCDGKTGKWVRRVVTATFQQEQLIQPGANEITVARINLADCQTLWQMGLSLKLSMLKVDGGDDRTPRDVIQAHEKVHQEIDSEDMKSLYDDFVGKINAISTNCDGNDFAAAMKATDLAATDARIDFLKASQDKFDDSKDHKQPKRFFNAVRPKAEVWYNKVRKKMIAKRCANVLPPL